MEIGKYNLSISYDPDMVLEMAECKKEDPNYNKYRTHLQDLVEEHLAQISAKGYMVPAEHEGEPVLFCMVTLGDTIDKIVAKAFESYDYLDGMMLNALGDNLLFSATTDLFKQLRKEANKDGVYLSNRVEPGSMTSDMSVQKVIYDAVVPTFDLDLIITEGFMLAPSKTLAYYYRVTDEDCSNGLDHDCSTCDLTTCSHRKYLIRIHKGTTTEVLQARKGENLLELLRRHNVYIDAPCSGMKSCGKCKIKAQGHGFDLGEEELKFLSKEEEKDSVILACFHEVNGDLDLYPMGDTQENVIETGYADFEVKSVKYDPEAYVKSTYPIGIGVDIGTTTLAVSLVNLVTHQVLDIRKRINPQKAFGADVISRIMYTQQNADHGLGRRIKEAIEAMSLDLVKDQGYDLDHLEAMVVSGNTTMMYLLLDIDPSDLAVAPFTTIDMGMEVRSSKDLFEGLGDFDVTILPFISAYVGGDIVSGLFATHMKDKSENIVFVDIGTNGEMVLRTKDRMISAATAAGPAFEGANIKCGMGSIAGAICEIHEDGEGYDIETMGDRAPAGICGSALIDAVALLHKQGYVDDMGFMAEPVMFHGEIGIYPEDIRQVQLAKAAIMAGVDVLLDEAGLSYDAIDHFYIAGGFGSHIDIKNSAYIGLIPDEVVDKVTVVGNTSLAGSVRYLLEKDGAEEIDYLRANCEYVELSTNLKFNEAYVMGMTFGDLKL